MGLGPKVPKADLIQGVADAGSPAAPAIDGVEASIRNHHARGEHQAAATLAMKTYGGELYRFVRVTVGNETDAADVNSELWEDIWTGLPRFEWRSSFRTWSYILARHACTRLLRHPRRRRIRPLSDAGLSRLEQHLRTTTWYLRDEVRDKLSALRERLDPDQRALLYLRVDRDMAWRDIASVMQTEDGGVTEAALRQQFVRVKKLLRELAIKEGLLPKE